MALGGWELGRLWQERGGIWKSAFSLLTFWESVWDPGLWDRGEKVVREHEQLPGGGYEGTLE